MLVAVLGRATEFLQFIRRGSQLRIDRHTLIELLLAAEASLDAFDLARLGAKLLGARDREYLEAKDVAQSG